MAGYLLLEGGREFGGQMEAPDRRALALAGGNDARVDIIPTAAAVDNNHERAGNNGQRWFTSLGATNVHVQPITDRASAGDVAVADWLLKSRLIYLLGGDPSYLAQALRESGSLRAMLAAHRAGAVLGGSSAGAMVLGSHFFDPHSGRVVEGFGLLPNLCVIPHHNRASDWLARIRRDAPGVTVLGVDERTGVINDGIDNGTGGAWQVYGAGGATLYEPNSSAANHGVVFESGSTFTL